MLLFLIFVTQAPWTAGKVLSTRIDKILKDLYKCLTKYNKVITEKLGQPHKLSDANTEIVNLYAFQLLTTANLLKLPWENFRKILQSADDND